MDIRCRQWGDRVGTSALLFASSPERGDPTAGPDSTAFARWTSAWVDDGEFTELIASWNAETPTGTWIEVFAEVTAEGVSGRYTIGRWASGIETVRRSSVADQVDDLATVDTDVLRAREGVTLRAWRLSVELHRAPGTDASPEVSMAGAMTSSPAPDDEASWVMAWGHDGLDVPAYSQQRHRGTYPEYNGGGESWCSAASVAMVLAYWQRDDLRYGPQPADLECLGDVDPQVVHAVLGTYDTAYGGTGNWAFNAAYAGRFGLRAYVTRLPSLDAAMEYVMSGVPLVASVSFRREDMDGAGYDTAGHLLVLVGFTETGDVIVNDPAAHLIPSNDEVRTTYDRDQFDRAWATGSGRAVYVIHPPDQSPVEAFRSQFSPPPLPPTRKG